jgi:hypothetical protein
VSDKPPPYNPPLRLNRSVSVFDSASRWRDHHKKSCVLLDFDGGCLASSDGLLFMQ